MDDQKRRQKTPAKTLAFITAGPFATSASTDSVTTFYVTGCGEIGDDAVISLWDYAAVEGHQPVDWRDLDSSHEFQVVE